jgi:hypothetical protein
VKSTLVGLLALFLAAILYLVVLVMGLPKSEPGTQVGFDPVSMFKSSPLFGITATIIFALGFYWEYRRVRSREPRH